MYTKTISVNTNWLDAIDGLKVADAIAYLQTLNSEYILTYTLEGDSWRVEISSELTYTVPMTNKEILAQLEEKYDKKIKLYEDARDKHIVAGRMERVSSCARQLEVLYSKLDEANLRYGE